MSGSYLGDKFDDNEISKIFDEIGAKYIKHNETDLIEATAKDLVEGKAVG